MTTKVFITYAHKDGPASNRFRQYIDDPLPPWAVDVREEAATPTPRTDAPLRLKLRDTGLYDDLGGLGQRIWTTAGQGYAKTEFVEAWALEQTQRELSAARAELAQEREKVEHLQVQLAGCGVASMSNTREALTRAREATGQYGDSASYQDCLRAVEREIEERERAERAEAIVAALILSYDPSELIGDLKKRSNEILDRLKRAEARAEAAEKDAGRWRACLDSVGVAVSIFNVDPCGWRYPEGDHLVAAIDNIIEGNEGAWMVPVDTGGPPPRAPFEFKAQSRESVEARFYRYLRDEAGGNEDNDGPMICAGLGDQFDFLRGEECDEAIRRAIDARAAIAEGKK